jgi:adenosylhomocysteine nucleosidase
MCRPPEGAAPIPLLAPTASDRAPILTPVLGVVAALPGEARVLHIRRPAFAGVDVLAPGVLLCVSGVGAEHAARAADRLLAAGAGALLSWGSAGALAPDLRPGSLLLPERVRGAEEVFDVDSQWRRALWRVLDRTLDPLGGTLMQSAQVLADAAAKRELGVRYGAQAVDMESAALAAAARDAGVRFLVVRAVADPADWTLPAAVSGAVDARGRVRAARVLRGVVFQPRQWAALLRLARAFAAARATLARVSAIAGPRFGLDGIGGPGTDSQECGRESA